MFALWSVFAYFRARRTSIQIAVVLMVVGAPFYDTWSVALSRIITRMGGPMGPLATTAPRADGAGRGRRSRPGPR